MLRWNPVPISNTPVRWAGCPETQRSCLGPPDFWPVKKEIFESGPQKKYHFMIRPWLLIKYLVQQPGRYSQPRKLTQLIKTQFSSIHTGGFGLCLITGLWRGLRAGLGGVSGADGSGSIWAESRKLISINLKARQVKKEHYTVLLAYRVCWCGWLFWHRWLHSPWWSSPRKWLWRAFECRDLRV